MTSHELRYDHSLSPIWGEGQGEGAGEVEDIFDRSKTRRLDQAIARGAAKVSRLVNYLITELSELRPHVSCLALRCRLSVGMQFFNLFLRRNTKSDPLKGNYSLPPLEGLIYPLCF